jgi:DNA ligase D-like protein (predicted 3'-phosphoesterase)
MAAERAGGKAGGTLGEYRRRRHFDRSPEPRGESAEAERTQGRPAFVVQVHDARTMHFDFRLEAGGVLKSWAVPKGPSADPQVKRFATRTEDHPLDYRDFEGVIAKGEYGGGTVMVWDEGTFRNVSKDRSGRPIPLDEAVERGHASFRLNGHKLHGGYALTRFRGDGDRASWLLVKKSDRYAESGEGEDRQADPRRLRSARTGRSLRRIAEDEGPGGDRR